MIQNSSTFGLVISIVLLLPYVPKSVPSPLVAIVVITALTMGPGLAAPNIGNEGPMTPGLPGFTELLVPLNGETLNIVWSCTLSIALVGLMESLLTAQLVDDITAPLQASAAKAGDWA